MLTTESPIFQDVIKSFNTKIGTVFIFDNYIITEFKEGIDINFENHYEVSIIIQNHFKDKPFGFLANRINSYSINLSDAHLFNEAFPNCKAYAITYYNEISEKVMTLENQFFKFNRKAFKNLKQATDWIKSTLESGE